MNHNTYLSAFVGALLLVSCGAESDLENEELALDTAATHLEFASETLVPCCDRSDQCGPTKQCIVSNSCAPSAEQLVSAASASHLYLGICGNLGPGQTTVEEAPLLSLEMRNRLWKFFDNFPRD